MRYSGLRQKDRCFLLFAICNRLSHLPGWLCIPLKGTVSMTHPRLHEIPDLPRRTVTENGTDSAVRLRGVTLYE